MIHWMTSKGSLACDSSLTLYGLHPSIYPKAKRWPRGQFWVSRHNDDYEVTCKICLKHLRAEARKERRNGNGVSKERER
jgi:hypothetical protein